MPERTCFACRKKAASASLLRFVCMDGCVVWDKLKRLPGRGAYLHGSSACLGFMHQVDKWAYVFRLKRDAIKSVGLDRLGLEIIAHLGIDASEIGQQKKKKKILI